MTDDVEKRFDRPPAFHAAAIYVGIILAAAAVAFAFYALTEPKSVVAASSVPAVLFLGGNGAFVKTYREWKVQGGWVAWQGAGWFLLTATLFCLAIPGAAMSAP